MAVARVTIILERLECLRTHKSEQWGISLALLPHSEHRYQFNCFKNNSISNDETNINFSIHFFNNNTLIPRLINEDLLRTVFANRSRIGKTILPHTYTKQLLLLNE